MRVVFVHGACVRDGSWWWRRTSAALDAAGVPSVCPSLPSCGEGVEPAGGPGLAEDVAAVRAELTASDEPTVVVGHSYGGIVLAEAAVGVPSVQHLVLISSYLPEPGESLATFGSSEPAPFLAVDPDAGLFEVRPDLFPGTFMHDCPDDVADSFDHLAAQSLSVVGAPVTASAWHEVPSLYAVCAADRGTPAVRQREFAQRASRVVEVDAGHHPFLSRPTEVAGLVLELAQH